MLVRCRLVPNTSVDFKALAKQLQTQLSVVEEKLVEAHSRAQMRAARAIQVIFKMSQERKALVSSSVDSLVLTREMREMECMLQMERGVDAPLDMNAGTSTDASVACEGLWVKQVHLASPYTSADESNALNCAIHYDRLTRRPTRVRTC